MSDNLLCEKIDAILDSKKIDQDKIMAGLGKYIYLINKFDDGGVDAEFQRVYNNFFAINAAKGLTEEFKDGYYKYMKKKKADKELALKKVLLHLKELPPNRVEASFGSKLLSMINPEDRPPWDRIVRRNLHELKILEALKVRGIKIPPVANANICDWDVFYVEICKLYKEFVKKRTESREKWMNLFEQIFDQWYSEYFSGNRGGNGEIWKICFTWLRNKRFSKEKMRKSITDVKIIDFILWGRKK